LIIDSLAVYDRAKVSVLENTIGIALLYTSALQIVSPLY